MKNSQLFQLTYTQLKQFLREPGALFWSFFFPIIMTWGLGIAFTNQQNLIRNLAVLPDKNENYTKIDSLVNAWDGEGNLSSGKAEITIPNKKLGNSTYRFIPVDWDSAMVLIKRGNVALVLQETGEMPHFHFDPLNPDAKLLYLQIGQLFKGEIPDEDPAVIEPLTATGTRYVDFLVPGLMTMGIMMSCMWGIGYTLIDKRSKKLMRRMVATPMKKSNFLLSQLISRIIITFVEVVALLIFAMYYFDFVIEGKLMNLILLFLAGNFAFIGIAILVGSRTSSTQMGNGLINLIVMPMMLLSGIFFSYHNFPDWAIPTIQKMPLTMFADSVRSVFIEGAGMVQIATNLSILTGLGLVTFVIGLKWFKWY